MGQIKIVLYTKRFTGKLEHLTESEQALYGEFKDDVLGKQIRLEQERIGFGYLAEQGIKRVLL